MIRLKIVSILAVGKRARWQRGTVSTCRMDTLRASTAMYVAIGWSRVMAIGAVVDAHLYMTA